MDKIQALHKFWSSFEIPAYEENSVPDSAKMPYITYEMQSDSFDGGAIPLSASLWYRSTSLTDITKKADEISRYIGMGGVFVHCDDGSLWIKRRTPFVQNLSDSADETVKRKIIYIKWKDNASEAVQMAKSPVFLEKAIDVTEKNDEIFEKILNESEYENEREH